MSDILIRGMEMPEHCAMCGFHKRMDDPMISQHWCGISGKTILSPYKTRADDCPLVPVPPHEDLIEESKVLDIVFEWCPDDDGSVGKDGDLREMLDEIEALPTIIPADEPDMDSFIRIFEEDDEEDGMDSFIRILKD